MAVGAGDGGTASGTSAARYRRPARQRHGGACRDHPGRTRHSASCRTTGYNRSVHSSARCNADYHHSASQRPACHCCEISSCCRNCCACSRWNNSGSCASCSSGARHDNLSRRDGSCHLCGSDTGNRPRSVTALRDCRCTARHGRDQRHASGGAAGRHAVQCATGHPGIRAPTGRATGGGHARDGWRHENCSACHTRQSHAGRRGSAGCCRAACCCGNLHSSPHAGCHCNVCAGQRASGAGAWHGRPGRRRRHVRYTCRGTGGSRRYVAARPTGQARCDGSGIRAGRRCHTRHASRYRVASPAGRQTTCQRHHYCRHRRRCPARASSACRCGRHAGKGKHDRRIVCRQRFRQRRRRGY